MTDLSVSSCSQCSTVSVQRLPASLDILVPLFPGVLLSNGEVFCRPTIHQPSSILSHHLLTLIYFIYSKTQLLQEGQNGILIVVKGDEYHTYELNGPVAIYVGPGDLHNPTFNGVAAEFLQDDNS
jgi:hypothetical protein